LRDVAAAAGVTAITVSRFLREPERVAEPTAQRIRAALQQTGYVPHKQAGMLASGQGKVVAVLLPNLANSIFAETAQGLADTLQPAGYELLMTSTGYSLEREEEQLRAVLGWRPAAVIVTGRRHAPGTLALLKAAQRSGTPVVQIWDCPGDGAINPALPSGPSGQAAAAASKPAAPRRPAPRSPFLQVGVDHAAIGQAMAQHLLQAGHRHLAYVDSGVAEDYRAHERGIAFIQAAEAAQALVGATVRHLVAPPGDLFDSGRQILPRLLASGPEGQPPPTAAAFANDHLASGALLQAAEQAVPIPQRLALLGFGDFTWARHLRPALSSVWLPRVEMGVRAGQLLLAALGGQAVSPRMVPLLFEMRGRGSTEA
jgi:LacI family gluconate utilization system Gnt-I transcriptional repressor